MRTRDAREAAIREARADHEEVRSDAARLEIVTGHGRERSRPPRRAGAEAVQASLDQVLAEVEQMERDGAAVPDARAFAAEEPEESAEEGSEAPAGDVASSSAAAAAGRRTPPQSHGRRRHREAAGQDRTARPREHDGDRAVRRARVTSPVPHDAAQGPRGLDRVHRRGDPPDRRNVARRGSARRSRPSIRTSRRPSAPCSAAAARASRCSTRTIRSRAASTSSPRPRASACRACSCSRVARRR